MAASDMAERGSTNRCDESSSFFSVATLLGWEGVLHYNWVRVELWAPHLTFVGECNGVASFSLWCLVEIGKFLLKYFVLLSLSSTGLCLRGTYETQLPLPNGI